MQIPASPLLTGRLRPGGQPFTPPDSVRAKACANLALVKYWGKRDEHQNLPAVGSISVTLAPLETEVVIRPLGPHAREDELRFNGGEPSAETREKVVRLLDLVRDFAGVRNHVCLSVQSNFPVAAGLASSASTFAALAAAANAFFRLDLDATTVSALARRGSGSAARSVFGGFVEWLQGEKPDGSDSVATPLAPVDHWPLCVVVAVTNPSPKKVSSTEGMRRTRHSPFFAAWQDTHSEDLAAAREAIAKRDLHRLGEVAEHSALKMHALMFASRPALLYWEPATLAVIHAVYELRRSGVGAYFSIDAGPQVKVLCEPQQQGRVAQALRTIPGVQLLFAAPGPGARVLEVQE